HGTPPELAARPAMSSLKALDAGRTSADQAPTKKAAALQLEDVTDGHAATFDGGPAHLPLLVATACLHNTLMSTSSKVLPSLFPCQPVPMAPCPLKAGTYVNATSIVLSTEMQGQLSAGLSATVKWRIESPIGSNVASVVAS
ncbi:unnamed protein product, partial [Polarella glacialis]